MRLVHRMVFWSHLLAGVIAGAVILMMSFTGFVLMYEAQITEYVERHQRRITPPSGAATRLSLEVLLTKVREIEPDARPATITISSDPAAAVIVNLGRDNTVFVNPYTGAILGGLSPLHHFMHEVVEWHRWFALESRVTGRAVTGACNLAFFWLAVTGVYLWWPRSWHWRGLKSSLLFNPRLRGKARDWNWHNVIGFWSSAVLIVLTLTAAVMSYPWANDLLYTLTGSEPPPRRADGPGGAAQRARRGGTTVRGVSAGPDAIFARAQDQVPGWVMITMRLAGRGDIPVTVSIQEPAAWNRFQRSQLTLDRATAEVIKWEPYSANSTGRKLRTWVRGLHTGEALGFAGQTVAGLASLGGCFLVWTGMAMAWRRFRYRKREAGDAAAECVTAPIVIDSAAVRAAPQISETSKEATRIEMEATDSPALKGHSRNGHSSPHTEWDTAPYNSDSVLVLYGSKN